MKNTFSLYTFFLNVYAGLSLGCTESHEKNITFLKRFSNPVFCCCVFLLLESLEFSVYTCTPFGCSPMPARAEAVYRDFFSLYTSVHRIN